MATIDLQPSAEASAEENGTAIATPVAQAIIKKGQRVRLIFNPKAVAIAGPGGRAHAYSDLIIKYIDRR